MERQSRRRDAVTRPYANPPREVSAVAALNQVDFKAEGF